VKPSVAQHDDRRVATVRASYLEIAGPERAAERAAEIASLPTVEWRGRTLRTIRCTGTRGRGPHDMHVPESLLWSLIDLGRYRCPYHA
jgi:hypothetical protein